jgi:hypothetical protein
LIRSPWASPSRRPAPGRFRFRRPEVRGRARRVGASCAPGRRQRQIPLVDSCWARVPAPVHRDESAARHAPRLSDLHRDCRHCRASRCHPK